MTIKLKRDLTVYMSTVDAAHTVDNTFKLNVKDISFSGGDSTTKTAYNYTLDNDYRNRSYTYTGKKEITVKLTTYSRFGFTSECTIQDNLLFESLTGKTVVNTANNTSIENVDTKSLPELYIYLDFGNDIYLVNYAVVKSARMQIDIRDYFNIEWTLIAKSFDKISTLPALFTNLTSLQNYIKAKLSILDIEENPSLTTTYNIPITTATLTMENSISVPIYESPSYDENEIGDPYNKERYSRLNLRMYKNEAVYDFITSLDRTQIDAGYNVTLYIGGKTAPNIVVNMPKGLIVKPKMLLDDVLTDELDIYARKHTNDNDDITIIYNI